MKNYFIWLSVFTVLLLALIDAQERFKELKTVSAQTPAQVEMKKPLNTKDAHSNTLDANRNRNKEYFQNDMRNKTRQNLQNSINDMNDRQKNVCNMTKYQIINHRYKVHQF